MDSERRPVQLATEELINKVAPQLPDGGWWYQLGLCLKVPESYLRMIKQHSGKGEDWCKREVLRVWSSCSHLQPTVASLARALNELQLGHIAQLLEDTSSLCQLYVHTHQGDPRPDKLPIHHNNHHHNRNYYHPSPKDVIERDAKHLAELSPARQAYLHNGLTPRSPCMDSERDMTPTRRRAPGHGSLPSSYSTGSTETRGVAESQYLSRGPHRHIPSTSSYESYSSTSSSQSSMGPVSGMGTGPVSGMGMRPMSGTGMEQVHVSGIRVGSPPSSLQLATQSASFSDQEMGYYQGVGVGSYAGQQTMRPPTMHGERGQSFRTRPMERPLGQGSNWPYSSISSTGYSYRTRPSSENSYDDYQQIPYRPLFVQPTSPTFSPYHIDTESLPSDVNAPLSLQSISEHSSLSSCYSRDFQTTVSAPSSLVNALEKEVEQNLHSDAQKDNPIRITLEPLDCHVPLNATAEFVCDACVMDSKEEPLYLWYKDSEPLIGEINNEYVVERSSQQDVGTYFCLVSHPIEKFAKKSRDAQLTLIEQGDEGGKQPQPHKCMPEILEQPEAYIEVAAGEKLRLRISAKGDPPLEYTWYKDTRELRYATSNVLEIPNTNQLDMGQYCCSVSNPRGSVLSDLYQVKVVRRHTSSSRALSPKKPLHYSQSSGPILARPRPTSFQKWDDRQPLTDRFLKEVALLVARQTTNWSRLVLYLGLSNNDVVRSRMYSLKPEDQAFQVLRVWKERRNGNRSTLETILTQAGIDLSTLGPHASTAACPRSTPKILVHPKVVKVVFGQTARLLIEVENSDYSTTYQWYRNSLVLHGKNLPELVIHSAIDSDDGEYFCTVTNPAGSTNSDLGRIEIIDVHPSVPSSRRPVRTTQPDLWAYSRTPQQYEEFRSRGEVDDDEMQPCGQPITTAPMRGESPQIVEHPKSQTVEPGSPLTLTCRAVGPGELSYVWYFNGLSLKDETRPEYFINCFTDEDEGLYLCEVTNSYGSVKSEMSHVTMIVD